MLSLINILWFMLAVLLFAIIVFVVHLVLLVKEAIQTVKISNQMLLEVNKELPRAVSDLSSSIHAANGCTQDITQKVRDTTDFLKIFGLFMGGIEGAKSKIGKEFLFKAMPSKKTAVSLLAGLKRAIEVLFAPSSFRET